MYQLINICKFFFKINYIYIPLYNYNSSVLKSQFCILMESELQTIPLTRTLLRHLVPSLLGSEMSRTGVDSTQRCTLAFGLWHPQMGTVTWPDLESASSWGISPDALRSWEGSKDFIFPSAFYDSPHGLVSLVSILGLVLTKMLSIAFYSVLPRGLGSFCCISIFSPYLIIRIFSTYFPCLVAELVAAAYWIGYLMEKESFWSSLISPSWIWKYLQT